MSNSVIIRIILDKNEKLIHLTHKWGNEIFIYEIELFFQIMISNID